MDELDLEILDSIDAINTAVQESEMNVLNALSNTYQKSIMILEYANDDSDLSAFDVFQEGEILDAATGKGKVNKKGKQENIIKKILLFIPRLVKAIFDKIKNFIKNQKLKHAINTIKKYKKEQFNESYVYTESKMAVLLIREGKINFDIDKFLEFGKSHINMLNEYNDIVKDYQDLLFIKDSYITSNDLRKILHKMDTTVRKMREYVNDVEFNDEFTVSSFITEDNVNDADVTTVLENIVESYNNIFHCSVNIPLAYSDKEKMIAKYDINEGDTHNILITIYRLFMEIGNEINRFLIIFTKIIFNIENAINETNNRSVKSLAFTKPSPKDEIKPYTTESYLYE